MPGLINISKDNDVNVGNLLPFSYKATPYPGIIGTDESGKQEVFQPPQLQWAVPGAIKEMYEAGKRVLTTPGDVYSGKYTQSELPEKAAEWAGDFLLNSPFAGPAEASSLAMGKVIPPSISKLGKQHIKEYEGYLEKGHTPEEAESHVNFWYNHEKTRAEREFAEEQKKQQFIKGINQYSPEANLVEKHYGRDAANNFEYELSLGRTKQEAWDSVENDVHDLLDSKGEDHYYYDSNFDITPGSRVNPNFKDSIKKYRGDYSDLPLIAGYQIFNNFHNEPWMLTKEVKESIRHLDDAIQSSTLNSDITVFRGTSHKQSWDNVAEIRNNSYTSTTYSPQKAREDFLGEGNKLLKITVPKGSKVLNINKTMKGDLDGFDGEYENILPRGTRFRFLGEDDRYVNLEVIPESTIGSRAPLPEKDYPSLKGLSLEELMSKLKAYKEEKKLRPPTKLTDVVHSSPFTELKGK